MNHPARVGAVDVRLDPPFAEAAQVAHAIAEHHLPIAAGVVDRWFGQHPGHMGSEVGDGQAVAEQAFELIGEPQTGVGQVERAAEQLTSMAVQPVGRHHIGIPMGSEERADGGVKGLGHPGFIHVHHHAVGGGAAAGSCVVKAAVGAALLPLLVLAVGVDQVHLRILHLDRLHNRPGAAGMVVVEPDVDAAEPQIEVVMNEFGDVGAFVGRHGDHITTVGFDPTALKQAIPSRKVAAPAFRDLAGFAVVIAEQRFHPVTVLRCEALAHGREHLLQHGWIARGSLMGPIQARAQGGFAVGHGLAVDQRCQGLEVLWVALVQMLCRAMAELAGAVLAQLAGELPQGLWIAVVAGDGPVESRFQVGFVAHAAN